MRSHDGSGRLVERIRTVLRETPLIDGHNDLPSALRKTAGYSVDGLDLDRPELHTDIQRMARGLLGAQFWSAWVPSDLPGDSAVLATLEQIDAVYRLVARYPDVFTLAHTAADVDNAFRMGRIASLIGIEGGQSIGNSLGALRMFARLGVRYMTLTHNDDTSWAASATGIRQTTGLDDAGRAVVNEMNRIGMIVDISHTAESTQRDALAVSTAPVIFSHSSARALVDHPRNVSDAVLGLLVQNGGVLQVTFVPEFVSQDCADWELAAAAERASLGLDRPSPVGAGVSTEPAYYPSAPRPGESASETQRENARRKASNETLEAAALHAMAKWVERNPQPVATLCDVADHLDHARDVAGIDHVGIGGDFDGTATLPAGLEDVSTYPALLAELGNRGWSDDDLGRLVGRNMLRVMDAVEVAATEPCFADMVPGA